MSGMFLTKQEKLRILLQSIIYTILIISASYFTICGNIFIRMIPMLYFLGIFGLMVFNNPIVTIVLSGISVFTFGSIFESEINIGVILFTIYSIFMVAIGELTGYILNLLYQNFKLRKFIKYYNKIIYFCILLISILIPIMLNNTVNSNMISYLIAKKNIDKYVRENYAYTEYFVYQVDFKPSVLKGTFKFNTIIDTTHVKLSYTSGNISDENMDKRKENLSRIATSEISILLKQNNLINLNARAIYDYSKISTIPDIIKISINNLNKENINDIISFCNVISKWDRFELVNRIDIGVDNRNVTIDREDIIQNKVTEEYILKSMELELLD